MRNDRLTGLVGNPRVPSAESLGSMVATQTEDFVTGFVWLVGGVVVTVVSLRMGARWWFVLPGLVLVAATKGRARWGPLDEIRLGAAPETWEQPRVGWVMVLLRSLPIIVVWFGMDVAELLTNPDVAGLAGGGVSVGLGLAWLASACRLVRYGRRHAVVIISDAPPLYGFWWRSENLLRAPRLS
jgi:hypothetical protein